MKRGNTTKRTRDLMVCQFRGDSVHIELFDDFERARKRKSALASKAKKEGKEWLTTLETNLR